jgi:hypothetical protein
MTIKYYDAVEQGSDEWHALRCGILTASTMKHVLTPTLKVANNDKTRAHVYEIAAQRVTKYVEPQYISDDMLRGQEDEIHALELYGEKYAPVKECGFVTNDDLGFIIGYSPDSLVGDDGLVEVKSRAQKYQMQTISCGDVPSEFMIQLQTGLWVTKRKWIDFVSYCAGMPMYVQRVFPLTEYQEAIEEAAEGFEQNVNDVVESYSQCAKLLHPTERRDNDFDII